jgi:hypothetical protein
MKFLQQIDEVTQQFSSAKTSIKQVAAGFKKVKWVSGTVNLDWGGGKYDLATRWLAEFGVTNYVYDPFNRPAGENAKALKSNPNTITCFNVLNVIKEDEVIIDLLKKMKKLHASQIYFTTYEGNRSGEGKQTSAGYQRNMKTKDYLPLVSQVFPAASYKSGMIII